MKSKQKVKRMVILKKMIVADFLFFCIFAVFTTTLSFASSNLVVKPVPSSGIAPLEVKLVCTVNPSTEPPNEYTIDFGDGSPQVTIESSKYSHTFTHTYESGFFTPACEVKKDMGLVTESEPAKVIVARWKFETGGDVDASPSISEDGTVIAGSDDGNIYGIDPETGSEVWRFSTGGPIQSSPAIGPYGSIYFGSLDQHFYALKPNGELKWALNIGADIFSSPAIGPDGRVVYVGANDNCLYAISSTGTFRWKFQAEDKIISAPSIGYDGTEHAVYFGSMDRHVYAVAASGTSARLKWKFKADAGIYASPAIGADGRIYIGELMLESVEEYNYKFYSLNVDGTKHWSFETVGAGFYSSAAIGPDGTIYAGTRDGYLLALQPDGKRKWSVRPGPPFGINSSPAVGSNNVVYAGSRTDNFYALNPEDEKSAEVKGWTFATGDEIMYSSPVIDETGTLYFGSRDNCVYAINPGNLRLANSAWPMFHGNPRHTGLAENIVISDIISTEPMSNGTNVARDTSQIKIHFSPSIDRDQIDIDSFAISRKTDDGEEPVDGYVYLDFTKYNNYDYRPTAIFTRLDKEILLPYGATYTGTIKYEKTGSDAEENIQKYTFSFTTEQKPEAEPEPDPKSKTGCFLGVLH